MGIISLPATSAAPRYHITHPDAPAGAVKPSHTHLSALPTTDAADENILAALGTMIAIGYSCAERDSSAGGLSI